MSSEASMPGGVGIRKAHGRSAPDFERDFDLWQESVGALGLCEFEWLEDSGDSRCIARLHPSCRHLSPAFDTLDLRQRLGQGEGAEQADPLLREIWVALLCAPVRIDFDSLQELASHVRVRRNIVRAAEKTALAFATHATERPEAYWRYEEEEGFLLQPGVGLVEALIAATQPESTGRLYDFSCYRAIEYVYLLGMAQEAIETQPHLYEKLQTAARRICFKGDRFFDTFIVEYGSLTSPVPMRYYVPGDRIWFKNPDEYSSDATGYEGSWVVYMGGGLFSNFWKRDTPFTLESKALEVYHWRDCAYLGEDQQLHIDESRVEALVQATQGDPVRRQQVLELMCRYRDPRGVYAAGGCMDATREVPRPLGHIRLE